MSPSSHETVDLVTFTEKIRNREKYREGMRASQKVVFDSWSRKVRKISCYRFHKKTPLNLILNYLQYFLSKMVKLQIWYKSSFYRSDAVFMRRPNASRLKTYNFWSLLTFSKT